MAHGSKKARRVHRAHALTAPPAAAAWQSPLVVGGGAVLVVMAIVVGFLVFAGGSAPPTANSGVVAPGVLAAVTNPDPGVAAAVGDGGQPTQLVRLPVSSLSTDAAGRPLVVYVGAEYCPFCAAERWSVVMALSRFGAFANLATTTSSSTDAFADTNTFTFHGSTYTSRLLSFTAVELQDRVQQPLESPSAQVARIFQAVDRPPYTATAGGFPFMDIGGRFALAQTGFSPQVLQGMSWDQIAHELSNAQAPSTRAIVGQANALTAAICVATLNQPADVCSAPEIQRIQATLPASPPAG